MKRFLSTLIGLLAPRIAYAYSITDTGWDCSGFLYCNGGGAPPDVVAILATNIVNGVWLFIGAMAVVAFFYGAILMITSRGEEGKEAGKKALIYASLGLVAALLVKGSIQFVCGYLFYLGGGTGAGICPT